MGNVVGANIKRCREGRAWTQERLAEIAAVNVRTVQRAERGEMIAAESLQDLAAALDVSLEMLRVDPEEMLKQAQDIAKRYKVIPLARIDHAHELKNCLTAGVLQVETVTLDAQQREAVAELEQSLGDYLNLWRDLQPIERHRAFDDLQRPIAQLQGMGLVVAAGVEQMRLRSEKMPEPWTMEVLYAMISLASDPKLAVAREKNRQISFASTTEPGRFSSGGRDLPCHARHLDFWRVREERHGYSCSASALRAGELRPTLRVD